MAGRLSQTYILATYLWDKPNAAICLGDIISDLNDPTTVLSRIDEPDLQPAKRITEEDYVLSQTTGSVELNCSIKSLDTVFLDPLEHAYAELPERLQEPNVQKFMKSGLFSKRVVYIVTGLKIARGLQLAKTNNLSIDPRITAALAGVGGMSVGVDGMSGGVGEISVGVEKERQGRSDGEFVFAYELRSIKSNRLRPYGLDISLYKTRAWSLASLWKGNSFQLDVRNDTSAPQSNMNLADLTVDEDAASHGSAAAAVSITQEFQAPTDSGYASGFHPKATDVETRDQHAGNDGLCSAQTTYTDSNISTSEDRGYISEFAAQLALVIDPLDLSIGTTEHILEILPQLLRAFALRVGYNANSAAHRDISVFVHRHRFQIRKSLRSKLPFEETGSDTDDSETIRDTSLNGEFSISRFLQEPDAQDYLPMGTSADAEDEQDIEMDDHQFRGIIQNTEAYGWLIASLKREANLTRSPLDIMQQIESDILGFLPEFHRVSRREAPQAYTIELQLEWVPLLFARQQEYSSPPDLSLQSAITLTGSRNNAQALTARQYLAQTWPNTGDYVMDLVTNAVRAIDNPQSSCVLPDGTDITVKLAGDQFIVTARGIADTLVEVGQQFAWLGAALRTSPYESGIATCVPAIERVECDSTLGGEKISVAVTFTTSEPFLRSEELLPGACWLPMFRNPVMVAGYPVRSRPVTDLGLEMPLNMMAELSGSTRADLFDGKVFLKGFSTMLIATKQAHDIIVWHYFYNAGRERLSYFDHALENVDNISLSSLNSARHVIGWCEDCKLFTGDPVLAGNIQRSQLPYPHAGCLLEKVNLSFSQFITGGVSMAVGVKDIPPHVTRNGYIPELRHLATRYVVLWDEADKRGWLVNGTNALLHTVRASLQLWAKDEFSASFMFDESQMADTTDHKPGSASRILSDPKNLKLKIHPGKIERFDEEETKQKGNEEEYTKVEKMKEEYYLLGHLMEMRLTALNQMIDHQVKKAGMNGINMKSRVRAHLEGWDFYEIGKDEELRPRVATLQALGYGWVDFVRSIGAITLLGRGFGEIIQPREDDMCPNWKRLPTQEYFLAVTTSDLINIMEKFGDMYTEPKKLVPDLAWHSPDDLLAVLKCRCQGKRQLAKRLLSHSREHRSPVQVPFPVRFRLILPLRSPQEFHEDGAVVFGHHISWKYPWSDDGSKGVMEVQSGLQRSRFGTSETDTSDSCPRASEATASDSQFSPSGSATPPTSMNLSIARSDISTQASTADDRARRLRLEKRRISRNR